MQARAETIGALAAGRPPRWRRRAVFLLAGIALLGALVFGALRLGGGGAFRFEEWPLAQAGGGTPVAIAAAPDGTVWFTLEAAEALGRLRHGRIEWVPKRAESIEPLGLAVDAAGAAWYTEAPKQHIGRVAADGTTATFSLGTPVARLGRLALGNDGAVWFAEPTLGSITRLQAGVFTRHPVGGLDPSLPPDTVPFSVAVAPDGAVWATLPAADKLVRLAPDGTAQLFATPTRRGGLGEIAVGKDGAVYFSLIGANMIVRFANGRFQEFAVPTPRAGLTGLAVGPDGAAWFTELRTHKIGRLRDGSIKEFPLPRPDARPFGIAVDATGNVWIADLAGWIGRLDSTGARAR